MTGYEITKYWTVKDFEISIFHKYGSLKHRTNIVHNFNGTENTGLCKYTYNELGFRGDSINKNGFRIMSLGCSITEGVGVNDEQTWPRQLSSLIPNSVDFNFGTSARSNDFISRCLLSYYDLIKPDLVLILYTFNHRREIYTHEGYIEPYIPMFSWGYMKETEKGKLLQRCLNGIQNHNEDFVNWYKNHLLIKYFLESKKCNWLWNGSLINTHIQEFNRFDSTLVFDNKEKYIDVAVDMEHPGPKHFKLYAEELFNHLNTKFPHYLNKY